MALGLTIAVIAALYVALTLPQGSPGALPGEEEYDYGETLIQGPLQLTPTYNGCTDDYRPTYGATCPTLQSVFGVLPKVPADMGDVSDRVFRNAQGFVTLGNIPEAYWKNPEFYPGWSEAHFDEVYTTDRGDIVTPIGFGAYPSLTQVATTPREGHWTFTFFLKDGWGLTHWQGMVLSLEIPEVALKANLQEPLLDASGNPVTQDVTTAASMNPALTIPNDPVYEAASSELLVPLGADQRLLILEPNYPSFETAWVHRVTVDVDLSQLPQGTWFFLVRAGTPSAEIGELYFYEYGNFYQPSGFDFVLFEGVIVVL